MGPRRGVPGGSPGGPPGGPRGAPGGPPGGGARGARGGEIFRAPGGAPRGGPRGGPPGGSRGGSPGGSRRGSPGGSRRGPFWPPCQGPVLGGCIRGCGQQMGRPGWSLHPMLPMAAVRLALATVLATPASRPALDAMRSMVCLRRSEWRSSLSLERPVHKHCPDGVPGTGAVECRPGAQMTGLDRPEAASLASELLADPVPRA